MPTQQIPVGINSYVNYVGHDVIFRHRLEGKPLKVRLIRNGLASCTSEPFSQPDWLPLRDLERVPVHEVSKLLKLKQKVS